MRRLITTELIVIAGEDSTCKGHLSGVLLDQSFTRTAAVVPAIIQNTRYQIPEQLCSIHYKQSQHHGHDAFTARITG